MDATPEKIDKTPPPRSYHPTPTRGAAPLLEPIALPPAVGVLGAFRGKEICPEDTAADAALESGSVAAILAAILKEQRESNRKSASKTRSTIQIRPNVQWPTLDDNNQDVERFFLEFDGSSPSPIA